MKFLKTIVLGTILGLGIFGIGSCTKTHKDLINPISTQIQDYWYFDSSITYTNIDTSKGVFGAHAINTGYSIEIDVSEIFLSAPFSKRDTVSYSINDSLITTTNLNSYFSNRFNTANFNIKVMSVNSTNLIIKDNNSIGEIYYYLSK